MSVGGAEDLLSGVESLPSSPTCRSLPPSPLSSSRRVTARLYSSLQYSREQEARASASRQVSFRLAATPIAMTTAVLEPPPGACSSDDDEGAEPELSQRPSNGRQHIEEMEKVRSHIQSVMLRSSPRSPELLQPSLHQGRDSSHLLSGVEDLFPRYSRLRTNFDSSHVSSVSELQVIREGLDRERTRRKHSEQQLLALQSKTLELQQQLALAVSADRKKDIMIEQLDKTLEKVVEGWRRHEQEKSDGVRRLQEEKEAAERAQDTQRQALVDFEKSLSEAAEALDKEQKRNQDLVSTNQHLDTRLAELGDTIKDLQGELARLRPEGERLRDHARDLKAQLEQQSLQAEHTHTHLQQEAALLAQQLEGERERAHEEARRCEEARSRLQQLEKELEETRGERDTARVDRALDQARFEAQRSQWEVELRLSVEQQVTQRLASIQEENTSSTSRLREQQRKQLLDLSARHERELSAQMDEFRAQLQERDKRQHQLTLDLNHKIAQLQDELICMETSKRTLETQREELVSRLQGMMRSHWAEALRLLTSQKQTEGPFSPSSLWETSKLHSFPQAPDPISSHTTAAPQAVVLHLSRDRENRVDVDSEFSLLNHNHTFTPLEPVLDDTHLTAVGSSDVWERSLTGGARVERGGESRRERSHLEENRTVNPPHTHPGSNTHMHPTLRQNPTQDPTLNPTLNPTLRQNPVQSSAEPHPRVLVRGVEQKSARSVPLRDAPPLSITEEAPPTSSSSLCEERQSELQYYITKLLERSPGDPLEEPEVDQGRNPAQPHSTNSEVSSQAELKLEQLADHLHLTLPPGHTPQHLQQLLEALLRSGVDDCADPVRTNLDVRLAHQEKRERTSSRGRRHGAQGQRSGPKINAWR